MINSSPKNHQGIEAGALFRRGVGGTMMEVAEILEIGQDRLGIPHVRFLAYLMRGTHKDSAPEQRTLSLESFSARYKEKVIAEKES